MENCKTCRDCEWARDLYCPFPSRPANMMNKDSHKVFCAYKLSPQEDSNAEHCPEYKAITPADVAKFVGGRAFTQCDVCEDLGKCYDNGMVGAMVGVGVMDDDLHYYPAHGNCLNDKSSDSGEESCCCWRCKFYGYIGECDDNSAPGTIEETFRPSVRLLTGLGVQGCTIHADVRASAFPKNHTCSDFKRRPLKLRIKLSKIKGVKKKTCYGCKHLKELDVHDDLYQDYEVYECEIHPEYDDISPRHRRCADYEKYVAPPYVEKDTRCDLCERRETCTGKIDITTDIGSPKYICGSPFGNE